MTYRLLEALQKLVRGFLLLPLTIAHRRHSRQYRRKGSCGAVAIRSHGDHF
jgi:hypothetical protein